jgi:type IV pilus assembly protein PilY1
MSIIDSKYLRWMALAASVLGYLYSSILVAHAAAPQAIPPNIVTVAAKPMIVLNLSRDQEIFTRAYNEYSDIDSDGVPDVSYKHSFDYYGYFDSYKCYTYGSGVFTPVSSSADKYCSGQWSGNFLNWATMTKVDVLRKILYGGYRSTDTAGSTVLERANLPTDTHAFAKYYVGADLTQLAPFSADQIAPTRLWSNNDVQRRIKYEESYNKQWFYPSTVPANAPANGASCASLVDAVYGGSSPPENYNCVWFNTGAAFSSGVFSGTWFQADVGDQMIVEFQDDPSKELRGTVITLGDQTLNPGRFGMVVTPDGYSTPEDTVSYRSKWRFRNVSKQSVTLCNATVGDSTAWSYNNTKPPLMRVARGNYQLWNANERWQCYWSEEQSASNANNIAKTGLGAASSNPSKATFGVVIGSDGPDFNVRVSSCVTGKVGKERCKLYPSGNLKPIGLLHEYGESEQAEFALFTGSWAKNVSGGVLRSNMKSFKDEVNHETNGSFTASADIVNTLNKLRIYGYRYSDGTYIGDGNCTFQLTTDVTNGMCTDWGNPLGEIFTESLRYLAGKTPSSDFTFTLSGSKDEGLGLPKPAWVDPFLRSSAAEKLAVEAKFGPGQCRRISAINFNSSNLSFDEDMQAPFSTLTGGTTVVNLVNLIGAGEGIHGHDWFVGSNGVSDNRICDAKTITALGSVRGLCPDAPAYKGSFGIAGVAHWAWLNPIRSDISSGSAPDAFRVKTYSVALSTSKPRMTIKHPTSGKVIELQPSFLNYKSVTAPGAGTLIDFKVVEQTATSGRYLVVWEDSQQGGDRDQDHAGILRWQIVGDELHVFTSNYVESTTTPQGFGYTISGSDKDGPHFHTGIEGFSYTDSRFVDVVRTTGTSNYRLNASGGCEGCQVNDPESRAIYHFAGVAAGVLQDPLWYAAKWGGFAKEGATTPSTVSSWDSKKADGSAGTDGIPDNYFLAIRPDELERSLRTVFQDIVASSNTAPAVASAQLTEGSLKYVVRFDGNDGHGEISAYKIQTDGSFSASPQWKAHEKMVSTPPSSRQIITNEGQTGVKLTWSTLAPATQSTAFGTDVLAQARLDWYRGDRSNEAPAGAGFRPRNSLSVMGSVINSNPHVQRKPGAPLFASAFPGYGAFVTAKKNRRPVIWAGSNDGMVHGFDASGTATGGSPIMSYLPQPLHSRITHWINPGEIKALADGTPFTADVMHTVSGTTQAWATYLFSSLGRGGKGIFALDVTDPGTLSSSLPSATLTSAGSLNESNASNVFRWQFTDSDDSSGDMGYIVEPGNTPSRFTGQAASVAKMNNNKFAVIYGNGVNSNNGSAALYILFVDGPSAGVWTAGGTSPSYVKIVADTGPGNGLSQPTWVDTNADGLADAIYAGDLKGNLWKFDVSAATPASWGVAYHGRPLFKARAVDGSASSYQPISGAPEFSFHPKGGILVSFATGKALSSTDFPDTSGRPHSIYGIWDKTAFATMDATALDDVATGLPRLRTQLVGRSLTRQSSGDGFVEGVAINWASKMGWFVNLPATSEMVVSNLQVTSLKLLSVVSIAPPSGATSCSSAPDAYITFVDPITGLLNQNLMGELDVVVDGVSVKKRISSKKLASGDQMVTLAKDRTPKGTTGTGTGTGTGGGGGFDCIRVVGDKTDLKLCSMGQNRRVQWRELFNFRTGIN